MAKQADGNGIYAFQSEEYRRAFLSSLKVRWSKVQEQTLRGYQQEAVDKILQSIGPKPQLLHLATGGGKTRTANEVVSRWIDENPENPRVLWITKDWQLLAQAAIDFKSRRRKYVNRLRGDKTELHPLNEISDDHKASPNVVYTTIQTLQRDLEKHLDDVEPSLVVWDECHWGEKAGAAKIITACKKRGVPMLGLTATPRAPSDSKWNLAYSQSFHALVKKRVLAKPKVESVRTGVSWSPKLNGMKDADLASLHALGSSAKRDQAIIDQYLEGEYGKTVVFACDIDHANKLAKAMVRQGINAKAAHSKLEYEDAAFTALEEFKKGKIDVLVNVQMLTHGVDIPDIESVFLARPTTSDILFAQMVGRGARRHEPTGKTSFHVVDFVDNIQAHGELFERAKTAFLGAIQQGKEAAGSDAPRARPPQTPAKNAAPRESATARKAAKPSTKKTTKRSRWDDVPSMFSSGRR